MKEIWLAIGGVILVLLVLGIIFSTGYACKRVYGYFQELLSATKIKAIVNMAGEPDDPEKYFFMNCHLNMNHDSVMELERLKKEGIIKE